jgi:uncharacterized CHY-type Zn-finger protein
MIRKKYHLDCFRCGQCHKILVDPEYYVHDSKPCCIKCYNERFAVQCSKCFNPISIGKLITFDSKKYHSDCFRCSQCRKLLTNEKDLRQHNSNPCCVECFNQRFAPRCSKCSRPITDRYTVFKDRQYHIDCFVCAKCHRIISSTEKFYKDQFGFVCLTCGV